MDLVYGIARRDQMSDGVVKVKRLSQKSSLDDNPPSQDRDLSVLT